MGTVVLKERRFVAWSPSDVFNSIATGNADWLFGARFPEFSVGAPVRLMLPMEPYLSQKKGLEILARFQKINWPRLVVIEYEAPWEGRLSLRLRPSQLGTDVILTLEFGDDAVGWFLRQRGIDTTPVPGSGLRIGLLVSRSGSASVFAAASQNLATMAVEELNAEGGVENHPVHLIVADDATNPARGVAELNRLVNELQCGVVVTNVTSATFRALAPVAKRLGILLVYTPVNEGGPESTLLVRLGERPDEQVDKLLPSMMRQTGSRGWFLAGNDYVWPRVTNQRAKQVIESQGGSVLGEIYTPLGSGNFDNLIEQIDRSGTDLVVSTFVGTDEVAFERQFYEAGLRDRCRTIALALDECTNQHIGSEASRGLLSTFRYFEHLPTSENSAFLGRYRKRFGAHQPPISSISESIYEAVKRVGASARVAHSLDPTLIGLHIRKVEIDSPHGRTSIGDKKSPMLLAESRNGELRILETL